MDNLSQRLRTAIAATEPKLRAITEATASDRPGGGDGWSRKQELGHLVDSAANNRIRFINAALAGEYTGPSYDGHGWVALGGYADMPWADVVGLWTALNRALAMVVERIPAGRLAAPCRIGSDDAVTLEFVIGDYIDHMQHHLDHIVSR
jgi:DinB family protein